MDKPEREGARIVDTTNKFFVSGTAGGDAIIIMRPHPLTISKDDALNLAAWLVALADDGTKFDQILKAVRMT